jgi:hypothetical protein
MKKKHFLLDRKKQTEDLQGKEIYENSEIFDKLQLNPNAIQRKFSHKRFNEVGVYFDFLKYKTGNKFFVDSDIEDNKYKVYPNGLTCIENKFLRDYLFGDRIE